MRFPLPRTEPLVVLSSEGLTTFCGEGPGFGPGSGPGPGPGNGPGGVGSGPFLEPLLPPLREVSFPSDLSAGKRI